MCIEWFLPRSGLVPKEEKKIAKCTIVTKIMADVKVYRWEINTSLHFRSLGYSQLLVGNVKVHYALITSTNVLQGEMNCTNARIPVLRNNLKSNEWYHIIKLLKKKFVLQKIHVE